MIKEEAIIVLKGMKRALKEQDFKSGHEALNIAIETLSTDAVQGEWIKHKGKWVDLDFYPTKYECSQCHYCVDEGCDSIYCPNCGARMKAR